MKARVVRYVSTNLNFDSNNQETYFPLETIKFLKFVLHVPDVSILLVDAAARGIMVMFIFVGIIIIIILADLFLRLVFDVVVILILTLFPAGGCLHYTAVISLKWFSPSNYMKQFLKLRCP